ncbi:MAG: adenosylcobinamide-GDP ribazoletransferase [Rubrimonas sp.]|uniref:adenosylcobinamide-GDP ribazoletransferase n=1 Tax=Rubrimonas sp. TaxID=2036015 RepID=UPI002FDD8FFC
MSSAFRPHWRDPFVALSLLSRIPAPVDHMAAGARMAAAVWAHPLVGAALGAGAGAAFWALGAAGAAPGLAAAAALALYLIATGALHEDGLADCADGFGGGYTRARRLEIMRDSRVGTFGAAALCLALVAKWSLIQSFEGVEAVGALAASGALSRAATGFLMRWTDAAREDGLAASAGRPALGACLLGLVVATGLGAAAAGVSAGPALALALAMGLAAGWVSVRLIGGRTGDVLGAAQVLGEIAALGALAR